MSKSPIRVIIEALVETENPSIPQVDAAYLAANRIANALVAAGYMPMPSCGDCDVAAGEPHRPGCDVARCKNCGWQDIGDHAERCPEDRPSTVWTGRWPGEVEVEEYGLRDLNELALLAVQGLMRWDRNAERWYYAKGDGIANDTAAILHGAPLRHNS